MRDRVLLAIAGVVAAAGVGAAAPPDPQTKDAYRWRVVLSPGRHPVLSASFRDQLARDLKAALQGAAGPVAAVEVVDLAAVPADKWEPLWKEFADRGWPALDPAPGRELTGVKTHVLRVDYRDGQFHLEAKQHDGFTGLSTVVIRRQAVRSADMVSRLAGLMLEPDFGPTGTVDYNPDDPDFAKVTLKASGIGPLDRYVKLGSVFAVSVVREPPKQRGPGKPAAAPTGLVGGPDNYTPYTLLKVVEPIKDGAVRCRILTRWQPGFVFGRDWRRAAAVRCLKLPTVEAPVQLRLVGQDGTPHPRGSLVQVAATDTDFAAKPGPQDAFEFRDGLYRSGRSFAQVACVQVALGAGRPQQFPIPVLGGEAVTIRFEIKPEDEERAMFERACNDLRGRVADAALAQVALFREVSRLIDARQNRDALARAEVGHAATDQAVKALSEELKQAQEDPKAKHPVAAEILKQGEERLAEVTKSQATLAKRVADLREAVKRASDPIKLAKEFEEKELAERIKEYVARGDVDDALREYDKLIILRPTDQDLKDQREKLLTEWAPKDEEHRRARESFKAWTQAKTAADYREAVGPLKAAAEVFLRKRDRLGLRKLLNLLEPAIAAMKSLSDAADTNTEDGQRAIKDLEAVSGDVRQIGQDAQEYLKKLSEK
jgi:hypothetical protein